MSENTVGKCNKIPKNSSIVMDEFIYFKGMKYEFVGAGVSGMTYVSNSVIDGKKLLIKIVPYEGVTPKGKTKIINTRFTNEVAFQNLAALKGLGPTVYEYSPKGIKLSTDNCPFEFIVNSYFCQYEIINYIVMEYYGNGWTQLLPWQLSLPEHKDGVRELMRRLIYEAGIVNIHDVQAHIFFSEQEGYRMIDYDHAEFVGNMNETPKRELLHTVLEKLELQNNGVNNINNSRRKKNFSRGGYARRTKKNIKNKSKKSNNN